MTTYEKGPIESSPEANAALAAAVLAMPADERAKMLAFYKPKNKTTSWEFDLGCCTQNIARGVDAAMGFRRSSSSSPVDPVSAALETESQTELVGAAAGKDDTPF